MDKNLIKQIADLIATAPPGDRLELVERAKLVATGVATMDDIDSFSFDRTNDAKVQRFGDGSRLGDGHVLGQNHR